MTYQQAKESVYNAMTYLDCKANSLVVFEVNVSLMYIVGFVELTYAEQNVSLLTN